MVGMEWYPFNYHNDARSNKHKIHNILSSSCKYFQVSALFK